MGPEAACAVVASSWWWTQWCPKHVEQRRVKENFIILKLEFIWLVFIQFYHWWCTEPWKWSQDELLWVHSVFENILKVLIELLSPLLKVFQNVCYDTFILPSIISFFVTRVHIMILHMYLHPAIFSSLISDNPLPPVLCFSKSNHTF
jgi:hypothetical protein